MKKMGAKILIGKIIDFQMILQLTIFVAPEGNSFQQLLKSRAELFAEPLLTDAYFRAHCQVGLNTIYRRYQG